MNLGAEKHGGFTPFGSGDNQRPVDNGPDMGSFSDHDFEQALAEADATIQNYDERKQQPVPEAHVPFLAPDDPRRKDPVEDEDRVKDVDHHHAPDTVHTSSATHKPYREVERRFGIVTGKPLYYYVDHLDPYSVTHYLVKTKKPFGPDDAAFVPKMEWVGYQQEEMKRYRDKLRLRIAGYIFVVSVLLALNAIDYFTKQNNGSGELTPPPIVEGQRGVTNYISEEDGVPIIDAPDTQLNEPAGDVVFDAGQTTSGTDPQPTNVEEQPDVAADVDEANQPESESGSQTPVITQSTQPSQPFLPERFNQPNDERPASVAHICTFGDSITEFLQIDCVTQWEQRGATHYFQIPSSRDENNPFIIVNRLSYNSEPGFQTETTYVALDAHSSEVAQQHENINTAIPQILSNLGLDPEGIEIIIIE